MDLYTKTTLTNTRYSDLLDEADRARAAADGKTPGTGLAIRARGAHVVALLAKARTTAGTHNSLRRTHAHG